MRRCAITLTALTIASALGAAACSDGSGGGSPVATTIPGLLTTPSYAFGPTTTFMPDCAGMPTSADLVPIVGIPLGDPLVIATGTCEYRGLNDQTRVITLGLLTDPVDQAKFNELLASVGTTTPLSDPTMPGATIGPSNTVFVVFNGGIYTVVTSVNDQPIEQQYPISVAVLAMWTAAASA